MSIYETIFLLLAGFGIWLWLDTLKAREIGIQAAQRACAEEGLQFLDETVVGQRASLARDDAGLAQLTEDPLEEFDRYFLGGGDLLALDQLRGIDAVGSGEFAERAHAVIGLRGYVHSRILSRGAAVHLADPPHSPQKPGEYGYGRGWGHGHQSAVRSRQYPGRR